MTKPVGAARTRALKISRRGLTGALSLIVLLLLISGPAWVQALAAEEPELPGFTTQPAPGKIDPKLISSLREGGPAKIASAFVHFGDPVPYERGVRTIRDLGVTVSLDLPAANAVYAVAAGQVLVEASHLSEVAFLEAPISIRLLNNTAGWATRARTLSEPTGAGGLDLTVDDRNGNPIDGRGVGIAVVDSGIDASNPDLEWCGGADLPGGPCKTVKNFKVNCLVEIAGACSGGFGFTDVADSDTTSGHGTHVAGIAAGDGRSSDSDGNSSTISDRMFRGVAQDAKLYGFGAGEGLSILIANAAASFQWIYDNGLSQNPPIRIVTNSWGSGGRFQPGNVINELANALIRDRGMTVLFAAGNSGGDGSNTPNNCTSTTGTFSPPCTSIYGNNPEPGLIQVANYDDGTPDTGRGNRDGALDDSSSRGLASEPGTWPDLSAPGSFITSTCKQNSVVCNLGPSTWYPPRYGHASGTSMATPHVAGIVSFLYQVDPTITPAEVENLLEDTAYKFTFGGAYAADPANSDNTSSFDKGHGLADARLAVLRQLGLPDNYGYEASTPEVNIATPSEGETVTTPFHVAGGATTGAGSIGGSLTTTVTDGDQNDHPSPAHDLKKVTVSEDPSTGTVTISWEVANAALADPLVHRYALFNYINGRPNTVNPAQAQNRIQVSWNALTNTVTCSADAAFIPSCTGGRPGNGNIFTLTALASDLGATRGAIMFDAWAASYLDSGGPIQDRAPGDVGAGANATPARGEEHVFVGTPVITDPGPDGTVWLSMDGGVPTQVSPPTKGAFLWSQNIPGPLSDGQHCFLAELRINGASTNPATTDSRCVNVGAPSSNASILITSPEDGAEVPPVSFNVLGTSNYDAADGPASVQVRATGNGGYDSGTLAATNTSGGQPFTTWSRTLDLEPATGQQVTIIATLLLQGVAAATDTVKIVIPCGTTVSENVEGTPEADGLVAGWDRDTPKNEDTFGTPGVSPAWAVRSDPEIDDPNNNSFQSDASQPGGLKDDRLVSPAHNVSFSSRLTFEHLFKFDEGSTGGIDGGVLEVSVDGGAWQDILDAGGVFLAGGYNTTMSTDFNSPIEGRAAWSGFSEFIDAKNPVIVDLGALAGHEIRVRWRLTLDDVLVIVDSGTGWWVDDVVFTNTDCNRPVAVNDSASTFKNRPVTVNVLLNDSDPNGDPLTVQNVSDPPNGTAVNNGNGTVTYTPDNGFVGTDSFTYEACDPSNACDEATVSIVVANDSTPPSCTVVSKTRTSIVVRVQDTQSGLKEIVVTSRKNIKSVTWPPFAQGATHTVDVTATKKNTGQDGEFSLSITDMAGNQTGCTATGKFKF